MNNFINPENLLKQTGLGAGMHLVDFGAGGGGYALSAAKIVGDTGMVWALDIREESLSHLASAARVQRSNNLRTVQCDLDSSTATSVPDLSCELAVVSKILSQLKHPEYLVRQVWRVLKTGGRVLVVEWRAERTPLGPPLEQRLPEAKVTELFTKQGFKLLGPASTDAYHYGVILQK